MRPFLRAVIYRLTGPLGLGFVLGLRVPRRIRARHNPSILVLIRNLFQKDIDEIDRYGSLNWFEFRKGGFGPLKLFVPKELRIQRWYYPSLENEAYRKNWHAAERFFRGLLYALRLRGGLDGVLTAHIDYWQDEGLRRACARMGIPFLVLCQENYNIPKTYRLRREEFAELGWRFGGTAIATFSQHMRDFFVEAGICPADRVVVTGAPRFDGWQRAQVTPGRRIVVLSFLNPQKYYASADFFFDVVASVRRAVVECGNEFEIVVKCKNAADFEEISRRLGGTEGLRITDREALPELLAGASVIVGSNSLSMVEGLLSGAELIVPLLPGTSEDPDSQLFDWRDPAVAACIGFTSGTDALAQCLSRALRDAPAQVDRKARLALISRYIHHLEGEPSTKRVLEFIHHHIQRRRAVSLRRALAGPASPMSEAVRGEQP